MKLCIGKVNEKINKYRPYYQMASFVVSLYNIASKVWEYVLNKLASKFTKASKSPSADFKPHNR